MAAKFCRLFCGECPACQAAKRELEEYERVLESLSDEDRQSLLERDPDDPRSFALDSKGRP
jgi:hypothetical protein